MNHWSKRRRYFHLTRRIFDGDFVKSFSDWLTPRVWRLTHVARRVCQSSLKDSVFANQLRFMGASSRAGSWRIFTFEVFVSKIFREWKIEYCSSLSLYSTIYYTDDMRYYTHDPMTREDDLFIKYDLHVYYDDVRCLFDVIIVFFDSTIANWEDTCIDTDFMTIQFQSVCANIILSSTRLDYLCQGSFRWSLGYFDLDWSSQIPITKFICLCFSEIE